MGNKILQMLAATVALTSAATAEQWIIKGDSGDLIMRPRYDYDYSRRFKGSIEDDGDIRLRNSYSGERLRGHIDDNGYGRIRDSEGNVYRVRPR